MNITRNGWTLIHTESLVPVQVGQEVTDFRGDVAEAISGSNPHKPSSQGLVLVREMGGYEAEYYPSVYGLKWVLNGSLEA